MNPHGLCAPTTTVIDFAYEEHHPLRLGNYPHRHSSASDTDPDTFDDVSYQSYSSDEINSRAIALFDFTPENDNEVALKEGQVIWISYRHGQGWLVAEDPDTGENGLVPEEYVEIYRTEEIDESPKPFLAHIFPSSSRQPSQSDDSEWEDTDDDHDHDTPAPRGDSNSEPASKARTLEDRIKEMKVN